MNEITEFPIKPTLAQIQRLEAALLQQPQVDIPVTNHFAPGLYAREITIPAGVCVVGKLHRHTHMIMLVRGEIEVRTDAGMERLTGPCIWSSAAGTKRAIFAFVDSTLITFHPTEKTELAEIEANVIVPEQHELLDAPGEMKCLG